jgi:hypothetical protein
MLKMAFTATLATAVFAAGAQAAPACGKRDDVLAQLSEKFKEAPVGIGLANNGGLIELLTADTGATWTLIVTLTNGTTCLLAAGQDWQPLQTAALDGPDI